MRNLLRKVAPGPVKALYRKLAGTAPAPVLNPNKLELIDEAFRRAPIRSVVDLGGVWAVDAGYAFYAVEEHGAERAVIVDVDIIPAVHERQASLPQVELVQRNFAVASTAEHVGDVDAVILFDVLLHQVKPDWNEVLANYAPHTKHFLIYNQQYTGPKTVRLRDLGKEQYFKHVPESPDLPYYVNYFERPDDLNPFYEEPRTWRDTHACWQWGITDDDLRATMSSLGFNEVYYQNHGPWPGIEQIENHAFLFSR
jgi:hypothetical protein